MGRKHSITFFYDLRDSLDQKILAVWVQGLPAWPQLHAQRDTLRLGQARPCSDSPPTLGQSRHAHVASAKFQSGYRAPGVVVNLSHKRFERCAPAANGYLDR